MICWTVPTVGPKDDRVVNNADFCVAVWLSDSNVHGCFFRARVGAGSGGCCDEPCLGRCVFFVFCLGAMCQSAVSLQLDLGFMFMRV